ncbi:type IV secretion system DNA-binding domain-containing protein [uncultured Tateyamaria sp.]|uniref:type IV secretion system DNA-binding domain-containing protein n=1 Tax=uncultured Tateyamaria sp. TaxID=455651 RepID=UPI002635E384|nr:type IV secretion system DNA-binding domain-containing protein [uncultured Tateyamaria sp.]
MDDTVEILVGTAAFVLVVFAVVSAGAVAAGAAVPFAIGYAIYWHQVKSPTARERQQKERTWALYRAAKHKFTEIDISTFIGDRVGFPTEEDPNVDIQFTIASRLVGFEDLDNYPPEPPELCDTIEGGRYRDFLNQVSPDDYERRLAHICRVVQLCAEPPATENVANVIYTAVETLEDGRPILPNTSKRLDDNFYAQKEVPPREYKGEDIVDAYLRGTPLALMAEMTHDDSIEIPQDLRTRHHSIIGGTGHGKTQCLQQMILQDIEEDDACVIVNDSQGSMLEKLLHVVSWDRTMYLDGGNIRQPLALSAFSIGSTNKPEDEPKVRTAVALYEHMFAARDTALTTTQSTLYRFLSRFLMVIPNANFDTALSILQDGYEPYAEYVDQLDTTSQKFIMNELCDPKDKRASNSYRTTRQEVARRLFTLMESRTLKGMFNAPESKVDISGAIRDEKIILINTAQAVLGDEGAQLFGKYCFAQIAMEVLSRPETKDRVYLYLDEAQEYLSDTPIIRRLYEQGRKRGLCMITACQELDQLERAGIDKLINSLTSIKFAGGVSASDATKLAKEMDTDADTIRTVPELTFAAWLKHHGTGTYRVTPGLLEAQMDNDEDYVDVLKAMMLTEHHYDPDGEAEADEGTKAESGDEGADTDYESYWDDEPEADNPSRDENKKRPPADDDDGKPINPDAPQDLD